MAYDLRCQKQDCVRIMLLAFQPKNTWLFCLHVMQIPVTQVSRHMHVLSTMESNDFTKGCKFKMPARRILLTHLVCGLGTLMTS